MLRSPGCVIVEDRLDQPIVCQLIQLPAAQGLAADEVGITETAQALGRQAEGDGFMLQDRSGARLGRR